MPIVKFNWKEMPPDACRGGAVAVGNFDGVHRGHAALLGELIRRARAFHVPAVAMTFDPHPLQLLRPEQFQPVLTTVADRAYLIQSQGVDHVLILGTTPELLQLSAEEFFEQVIRSRLAAHALMEGVNFGFGRNREGNIDTLRILCDRSGVELAIVPPFTTAEGTVVSSSRARAALVQGDVRSAAGLLGRPYRIRGRVGEGKKRGRSIGFPTANLERIETLIPGDGVYAVRVSQPFPLLPSGGVPLGTGPGVRGWPGAANIGPNPTFGESAHKVEVHLIGFQGELTGQTLAVDFVDRLRETRAFAGVEALVEQLKKDVEAARRILGDQPSGGSGEIRDDLSSRVTRFLTEEVAPVLQMDGRNMQLLDIRNGVARVRIQGGCDGCPSSIMAVIMGLEQELLRRVPEIEYLEVVP
jgi:riboflavin kinase/FMN adenylyltransferase